MQLELPYLLNVLSETGSTNFTWLYFVFCNSLVFPYFKWNILYSVHLFGIWWSFATDLFSNVLLQTFGCFWKHVPDKLLISLCWHFYIKFKLCKIYIVASSMTRTLLVETLQKLLILKLLSANSPYTYTCMF